MGDETALRPSYRESLAPQPAGTGTGRVGASFLASFDLLLAPRPCRARRATSAASTGSCVFAAAASAVAQVTAPPIGGALSDRGGPVGTLLVGSAVFSIGTVIGGSATSLTMIAIARLVQGFGGGLLPSVPPVLWRTSSRIGRSRTRSA